MNSTQNVIYPAIRKIGKSMNKCVPEVFFYINYVLDYL